MPQTNDEELLANHEQSQQPLSTGLVTAKTKLAGEVIPTALMGPAQQGREPHPIILPHIAIGRAVAPNIPAILAVAPEYHPTLVLTPVTNKGKGETTGAHEQHPEQEEGAETPAEPIAPPPPKASPGQGRGYPVITTPIPTPGDLRHTTPFPRRLCSTGRSSGVLATRSFSS